MKRFFFVLMLLLCSISAQASQNAQSIQFLLSQSRTATTSLAGGKVYAYAAGTTTAKTVWLDRGKTTPAANPYTLDTNGTAQLYADGIYRIVIKDAAGVTRYDRDNLAYQDLASNGMATITDYADLATAVSTIGSTSTTLAVGTNQTVSANLSIPATLELLRLNVSTISVASGKTLTINGSSQNLHIIGAGNVVINGRATGDISILNTGTVVFGAGSIDQISPQMVGAVDPTGATSSQAAFTRMVATLEASTVGKVYLPAGTYKTNIHTYTFQSWEGAGVGITKIIPADSTTPILWVSSSAKTYSYNEGIGFSARGFTIDGKQAPGAVDSSGALTGQHGIYLDGGVWMDGDSYPTNQPHPQASIGLITLQHLHVTGCSGHGIFMDGTNHGIAHNSTSAQFTQVAWVDINNVQSTWNKGNGIRIEGMTYQTHIGGGCLVEKNAAWITAGALGSKNDRAQLYIGALNNGFNYTIVIDGGSTFQSTGLYSNMTTAETCGVSLHAVQNVQMNGIYVEQNTRGIYTSGGTTARNISIVGCMLNTSYVASIDFEGGTGLRAEGNYFTNGAYGTAILMNPTGGASNIDSINIADNTYVGFIDSTHYYNLAVNVKWVKLSDKGKTERPIKFYSVSTTVTIDLDASDIHYVNMDGVNNITSITFIGTPIVGRLYTIGIWQGGVGSKTVGGWPATIKWGDSPAGNVAPTISTAIFRGDIMTFRYNQNGYFYQESSKLNVVI